MGILRQHFNPTILSLYVPRESGSPEGPEAPLEHVRVGKYPTFTLIADAVGHAFNGSYYVQLSYGEWVIGSMAIFSRGEATQCSSCQGRARDGTRTRGVIDIPEVIVDQMVKDIRVGHKNVPMGDIVQHITTRITQKVVGPTGVLLAIASPKPPPESSAQDDPQSGSPLKKSIAPSVKLLSSFTAIPTSYAKDPTGAPLHYFGGCDHGTLETNEQGWTWA
ncbi:hypothetical protein FIBSPDRAFT_38715 [Athelia psychrophila]|uniref:Uncharacterized protein n=1 Tax=Athelia psychrophila TaxID=1759441 RepID=A0A166FK70_9AGAM|nr:hypothetical protein FIBSPDRAFT_38715 [Fibularhizoctonia sp. CBS 109695]